MLGKLSKNEFPTSNEVLRKKKKRNKFAAIPSHQKKRFRTEVFDVGIKIVSFIAEADYLPIG